MKWAPRLVGVLAVLALAGCGADKPQLERTEPRRWAKQVCGAIVPMSSEITRMQQDVTNTVGGSTDTAAKKQQIVTLFTDGKKLTDDALRKVERAGVPDVKDGRVIADSFVRALVSTRDSFDKGRKAIQALPTDDSGAFNSGVVTAFEEMSADNDKTASAFQQVKAPELDKAFSELQECRPS